MSSFYKKQQAAQAAAVLKAIAHPQRLQIVMLLSHGSQPVGAIAERLEMLQPVVSQQLKVLKERGLVKATRQGGFVYYALTQRRVLKVIACVERCIEQGG